MPGSEIAVAARASLKNRVTMSALHRELGVQDLDRRAAAEHRVLGEPDRAHAAFADLLQKAIGANLCGNHESNCDEIVVDVKPRHVGCRPVHRGRWCLTR